MIENFRKVAKNPVMKVLLGLLVVSFMLSGLSAGFLSQTNSDNYIVKVAGDKIYPSQVDAEYKNISRSFSERGMEVDDKMLAAMGVSQEKILNDLVRRKLIFAEVGSMGLTVSNDFLRKEILSYPVFQVNGKFDSDAFKRFLYNRGMREHQYLDEMRQELSAQALMTTLFGDIETPSRVFDLLKNREATRYDVDAVVIPFTHAELKKEPTEQELKDFHFTNSDLFEIAETRDIEFVELPKLADEKASHEMAVGIEDDIAGGATITEIAKKHSASVVKKDVTKGDGDIAALAFGLQEGEVSEVKETQNADGKGTYLIVQLNKITEKHVPELDKIKDKVTAEWTSAEKEKQSKQLAIDLYEKSQKDGKFVDDTKGLSKKTFSKATAQSFTKSEGLEKLRGTTPAEAKQGDVFGLFESKDGFVIARLESKSTPALSDKELQQYKDAFGHTYATELEQSYMNYLAAKHGVEFNSKYEKK